ncbi:NAD(+) synthase, partial [Listeria welshimeri]|nr:NAD(+) synthase [Listeria welshimeri]
MLREQIIREMQVSPRIDPKEEIRKSVDLLKAYLKKNSFLKTLVLGISGGRDPTLAGKISQIAISELREETKDSTYQFIAVSLPYGEQLDEADRQDALAFIEPDKTVTINIKKAVDASAE